MNGPSIRTPTATGTYITSTPMGGMSRSPTPTSISTSRQPISTAIGLTRITGTFIEGRETDLLKAILEKDA